MSEEEVTRIYGQPVNPRSTATGTVMDFKWVEQSDDFEVSFVEGRVESVRGHLVYVDDTVKFRQGTPIKEIQAALGPGIRRHADAPYKGELEYPQLGLTVHLCGVSRASLCGNRDPAWQPRRHARAGPTCVVCAAAFTLRVPEGD